MAGDGHFLERIELFGFKSFARRTTLEFGAGITSLVGPNGCGKSNIIDAIRWVLGEHGGRSARTKGVADIIFDGGRGGRPPGMAEVAITFRNHERRLPVDYAEVCIRRRIYRSGESEYSLNNQPVQLKDIRALLHDTGIGKSAYSILEQGRIDQLLNGRPEDRRAIFEEAAGISRYKFRNRDVQRKLQHTIENMRIAREMLAEVEQSHSRLKQQAEVALRYRALRERQRTTTIDRELLRFRSLTETAEQQRHALEEQTATTNRLQQQSLTQRKQVESALGALNSLQSELADLQGELDRLEMERTRLHDRIENWQGHKREIERRITREEGRLQSYNEHIAQLQHERTDKEQHLLELQDEAAQVAADSNRYEEAIAQATATLKSNEKRQKNLQATIKRHEHERAGLISEMSALASAIVAHIDEHLKAGGYSTARREEMERALSATLDRLRSRAQAIRDLLSVAASAGALSPARSAHLIAELRQDMESLLEEIALCEEQLGQSRSQIPAFLDELLSASGDLSRRHALEEQIGTLQQDMESRRAEIDLLAEQNRNSRATIEQSRPSLERLRVSRAQIETLAESRRAEVARTDAELERQNRQIAEQRLVANDERRQAAELTAAIADAEQQGKQLIDHKQQLQAKLERQRGRISTLTQTLQEEERQTVKRQQRMERERERQQQLQLEAARTNAHIEDLRAGFHERYGGDPQEYEQRIGDIQAGPAALGRTLKKIEAEIATLGDINLMAIEECKAMETRYTLLRNQYDDLSSAYADLQRISGYMTKTAVEDFERTLKEIRAHFHYLFRRLFNGGRADIGLVDPDNVLESGIDIIVHPPGKRAANIELLSGGERSLVAAGLLFAIFMARPSPFYCFDEIDAALDDANIDLFMSMMREFEDRAQFILISHNKKTVAHTRTLYGITMEENGVSKLVALRPYGIADTSGLPESDAVPAEQTIANV